MSRKSKFVLVFRKKQILALFCFKNIYNHCKKIDGFQRGLSVRVWLWWVFYINLRVCYYINGVNFCEILEISKNTAYQYLIFLSQPYVMLFRTWDRRLESGGICIELFFYICSYIICWNLTISMALIRLWKKNYICLNLLFPSLKNITYYKTNNKVSYYASVRYI
jgi:hypothetical protein